jgi:hypothetical protein
MAAWRIGVRGKARLDVERWGQDRLSAPLKALIMLVVAGAAVLLYVVVASVILEAVR